MINKKRLSGVLLHPTSFPGPYGIGDLGPEAYKFVDFLVAAGQSLWQVLPLGPTGYGDSPYACYSAFAGNTLLISPEQLVNEGLLSHRRDAKDAEVTQRIKDLLPLTTANGPCGRRQRRATPRLVRFVCAQVDQRCNRCVDR